MDVSNFVETTFDDGVTKRRNIGPLRRALDEFGSQNLGLLLDEAKTLLRRLTLQTGTTKRQTVPMAIHASPELNILVMPGSMQSCSIRSRPDYG